MVDLVDQLREKARWRPGDIHGNLHIAAAEEIERLRKQVEISLTALRRINSLAEKNVPKYAQQIASETLPRL